MLQNLNKLQIKRIHKDKIKIIRSITSRKLHTAVDMITVCYITVTQRLTVRSIKRIKTLGFTVYAIEAFFTSYT